MVSALRLNPLMMLLAVLVACPATVLSGEPDPRVSPLPTIDPRTPTAKLLPIAPNASKVPVYLGDDLRLVPEVNFEASSADDAFKLTTPLWINRKARTAAAVLHLNAKEEDGFLKALVRSRPDLSGMPFLMGKACRADEDRAKTVKYTAQEIRKRAEPTVYLSVRYQRAHIAVMAQNLIGHDAEGQKRALKALTSTRQADATRE